MTPEQKLLKLLQVAVENGWKTNSNIVSLWLYDESYEPVFENNIYLTRSNYELSLNDLVTNWEEGEVSFVESLCKAVKNNSLAFANTTLSDGTGVFSTSHKPYVTHYMRGWILQPTSKRFDWLFETFKHLLV